MVESGDPCVTSPSGLATLLKSSCVSAMLDAVAGVPSYMLLTLLWGERSASFPHAWTLVFGEADAVSGRLGNVAGARLRSDRCADEVFGRLGRVAPRLWSVF